MAPIDRQMKQLDADAKGASRSTLEREDLHEILARQKAGVVSARRRDRRSRPRVRQDAASVKQVRKADAVQGNPVESKSPTQATSTTTVKSARSVRRRDDQHVQDQGGVGADQVTDSESAPRRSARTASPTTRAPRSNAKTPMARRRRGAEDVSSRRGASHSQTDTTTRTTPRRPPDQTTRSSAATQLGVGRRRATRARCVGNTTTTTADKGA